MRRHQVEIGCELSDLCIHIGQDGKTSILFSDECQDTLLNSFQNDFPLLIWSKKLAIFPANWVTVNPFFLLKLSLVKVLAMAHREIVLIFRVTLRVDGLSPIAPSTVPLGSLGWPCWRWLLQQRWPLYWDRSATVSRLGTTFALVVFPANANACWSDWPRVVATGSI